MKIKNEDVTIKIGKIEKCFKNRILDNYIELYRDSFLEGGNKAMQFCFIQFNEASEPYEETTSPLEGEFYTNYTMSCQSVLKMDEDKLERTYENKTLTTKYIFEEGDLFTPDSDEANYYWNIDAIAEHIGDRICGIGFGSYFTGKDANGRTTIKPLPYAYLDVSAYNVIIQPNQELKISRTDKITSDLDFYTENSSIEFPIHLSPTYVYQNLRNVSARLHSICLGTINTSYVKEILKKDIQATKDGIGTLILQSPEIKTLYPSKTLYPNKTIYPTKKDYQSSILQSTSDIKWIFYKFRLYGFKNEGTYYEEKEDLDLYYLQRQQVSNYGKFKLKIKYERG